MGRERGLCGLYPRQREGRHILVRGPHSKEGTDTLLYELTAQFGLAAYRTPAVAALTGVAHQT